MAKLKALFCLALSACLVLAFAPAVTTPVAEAFPCYDDETGEYVLDGFDEDSPYCLAVGGVLVVPEGYDYSFSEDGVASYDAGAHAISGLAAGEVEVTYREAHVDDEDEAETGSFTLRVISYAGLEGKSFRVAYAEDDSGWGSSNPATLKLPVEGASEEIGELTDAIHVKADSEEASSRAVVQEVGDGYVVLGLVKGSYKVSLYIYGATVTISVKVVKLSLNESSLVLCKGKSATLKVKNAKDVSFESGNDLVATVGKSGKVTPKQLGNSTISITADGVELTCAVGVTTKKAYQAVANARADLKKKYKYSQKKRMQKNYRDCGSFVSRCYWDSGLKRRIFAIGGPTAKTWALTAADQAKWLKKQGRSIGYKGIDDQALLPGDTIYYQTGYAGTNGRYLHIDHAAIYVGGGLCLNTGGWGGKGTVGYRYWNSGTVKFVGRPISAFTLNRASISLKKAGKTAKLKSLCAKGKVKYSTSKAGVATVSSKGKVTAKGAGICIVTAKCKAGTYRCKVTVG